ncbi:DNA primase [Candidatus Westeberhardia cardiocondylae]|uniref:DNA primase n=1 Tax=Candidatus Westeberhardia cardiocondylae TaxID=1594731 RepID=A0A0H5C4Y8_9ENTR|nr:DNA primase [Candidatus Westeberhardia cardiocondylae]CEN32036.1 DNA primase [Candidatus Westeberhardia cardiocondylae]
MLKRISRIFITDLLIHVNIVDLISSRVKLKKKGSNFYALCPFHYEKNPSFSVNHNKQFYYCFGCGAHGNAIDFIMCYDQLNFVESVEELALFCNLDVLYEVDKKVDFDEYYQRKSLYKIMDEIARFYQNSLRKEKFSSFLSCYLQKRGLDNDIIKQFSIGYSPIDKKNNVIKVFGSSKTGLNLLIESGIAVVDNDGNVYDRFQGRVIFPIQDDKGRVVAFGGRRIFCSEKPKYLNSPETRIFHKARHLYGLYHVRLCKFSKLSRIIVVEGYMDVLTLRRFGINYVVALLGTSITCEQIQLLYRFSDQVICCFDGDFSGRRVAWNTLEKSLSYLVDGKQMKFMFLPNGEDPDSLIKKIGKCKFEKCISFADPLSKFLFEYLMRKIDLSTPDGLVKLGELALPLINKIPGKTFRLYLRKQLGYKLGIIDEYSLEKFFSNNSSIKHDVSSKCIKFKNMRMLISLLVQNPQLSIFVVSVQGMKKIPLPGLSLFIELIQICKITPSLTTGQLLEYYRGREYYFELKRLAVWDNMIHNNVIEEIFIDFLIHLYNFVLGHYRDALIVQDRISGLTKKNRELLWILNKVLSKKINDVFSLH